jgi:plastocyanin
MRPYHPVGRSLACALAALTIAVAGCGDDDDDAAVTEAPVAGTEAPAGTEAAGTEAPADAGGSAVTIVDFAFSPETLEVAAGTEVTWTNEDGAAHRIAGEGDAFGSEDLGQGDTFSFTFDEAGEFPYICGIHPSMTGTITVT